MERLDEAGAKVLRTDELGAIIFSLSPSGGVQGGGGVATYLPKNNRGFAENFFFPIDFPQKEYYII